MPLSRLRIVGCICVLLTLSVRTALAQEEVGLSDSVDIADPENIVVVAKPEDPVAVPAEEDFFEEEFDIVDPIDHAKAPAETAHAGSQANIGDEPIIKIENFIPAKAAGMRGVAVNIQNYVADAPMSSEGGPAHVVDPSEHSTDGSHDDVQNIVGPIQSEGGVGPGPAQPGTTRLCDDTILDRTSPARTKGFQLFKDDINRIPTKAEAKIIADNPDTIAYEFPKLEWTSDSTAELSCAHSELMEVRYEGKNLLSSHSRLQVTLPAPITCGADGKWRMAANTPMRTVVNLKDLKCDPRLCAVHKPGYRKPDLTDGKVAPHEPFFKENLDWKQTKIAYDPKDLKTVSAEYSDTQRKYQAVSYCYKAKKTPERYVFLKHKDSSERLFSNKRDEAKVFCYTPLFTSGELNFVERGTQFGWVYVEPQRGSDQYRAADFNALSCSSEISTRD